MLLVAPLLIQILPSFKWKMQKVLIKCTKRSTTRAGRSFSLLQCANWFSMHRLSMQPLSVFCVVLSQPSTNVERENQVFEIAQSLSSKLVPWHRLSMQPLPA